MKGIIIERVLQWTLFSVGISLLPIVFGISSLFLGGKSIDISKCSLNGEFFIISVGLSAGVLGDLFSCSNKQKVFRLLIGGMICLLMLYSCFSFADVLRDNLKDHCYLPNNIFITSITTLGITIFCCLIGIILTEIQ